MDLERIRNWKKLASLIPTLETLPSGKCLIENIVHGLLKRCANLGDHPRQAFAPVKFDRVHSKSAHRAVAREGAGKHFGIKGIDCQCVAKRKIMQFLRRCQPGHASALPRFLEP